MDTIPVVIDRMSFWDRPHFSLSVGDEIRFRLEFVPSDRAAVPADLHVTLDGAMETVAVLQRRDELTGLAEVRLRVTAGAVVATWTAHVQLDGAIQIPTPRPAPMPIRGALVGGWFGAGVEPLGPLVSGTVRRIRVLRQRVVADDGPRRWAMAEGAELRDVLTAPREFESYDGAPLPTDAWEETGVVVDLETDPEGDPEADAVVDGVRVR